MCPGCGGHVWSMLPVGFSWLSLKTTIQQFTSFIKFGPQNLVVRIRRELEATHGIIVKDVLR
jgi:hypothetical protein